MNLIKNLNNEFRLIRRDAILLMLLLFVVYMGIVIRFLLPWLNNYLSSQNFMPGIIGNDSFSIYYPLFLSFMVVFTGPQLAGAIFGFLILSDKDDQTIKALMVTPMSSSKYIGGRIIVSAVLGFIFILAMFYMINIELLPFWINVFIALGGGSTAPLIMLFLSITSESKVQGMSYSKFLSFIGILLIISWFVSGKLQLLFGILPPYWISKSYWLALENNSVWLLYLAVGIIYQIGLIVYLSKLFQRNIYKKF